MGLLVDSSARALEGLEQTASTSGATASHNNSSSQGFGLQGGKSDFSTLSGSSKPGNWSSQASWRKRQSEHAVIKHCSTVFDSLQNIPEKTELQSHIFKLEKAIQQIYTLRVEGNAKVFQTCSHVVSELEAACTLFELELPKHISELRALGEALATHGEVSKTKYVWRLTQFLSNSTLRIKEFNRYLAEAMEIQKALQLRLVVHDFGQWNSRASNHLVSGLTLNKLLLVTFRLRKLAIPQRLIDELDVVEDQVQVIAREVLPQDDEGFEEYLEKCRECTVQVSGVLDAIIAGKGAFNVQQEEIDSCLSQMKLLKQTNTTMEETPKAAIAVIESLQDILISMNQVNVLVRGVQAFFKIKLRQKEDARKVNMFALFNLLLAVLAVLILIGGSSLLIIGLLDDDEGMASIGIAMLASTALIYLMLTAISSIKRRSKSAILPVASSVPVKATVPVKRSSPNKKLKKNAVAPLSAEQVAQQRRENGEDGPAQAEKAAARDDPKGEEELAPAEGKEAVGDVEAKGKDEKVDEKVLREEVVRYAVHLGMDPEEDTDLFWIAEQAYHAHLPSNWAQYSDDKGNLYYFNKVTGISSWSHPLENQFRSLYMQMKASKERFGSMPSMQQQPQGVPQYNPQRFHTGDSNVTSDNESEYESEGSRFETSRDSFSSSFMGSYFSSLVSPRGEASDLTNSISENPKNRSYTSGVTGKQHQLGGSSVNLEHIPRSKFSESSPAFMRKKKLHEKILERSYEDLPISARPPPTAFLASLSDSSAGRSMQKALNNIMKNM
ncbi:WW domain-containing protein [Chloropicon primus]|uniref:WW domain-containing protein n=1 Tax=Chloropicon primus TaxID=1764295 RepID=A0A5B8MDG8_9CHLO|nr:hypothetical protein A3770_01p09810 [Chloropicon primus]UPQ97672.1 WW domain-containing protein [Chloropicon primus]|eukprot:QDZ18463.1 hypothetical protein A3770_01p09810 [Chloropicon primus]